MEFTVLMENECRRAGLTGAHGVSVWVQGPDVRLLFDTGPDGAFLSNAQILGVDVKTVTAVALSHNHWDHTGGLLPLLDRLERPLALYGGRDFYREKYGLEGDSAKKLSQIRETDIHDHGIVMIEVHNRPLPLGSGLFLLGGFDRPYPFETLNGRYVTEWNGRWKPDPFADEIAFVYEGKAELTMLVGCAHPGVAGMVAKVREAFGKPVHMLLGGAHLANVDEERVERTAGALAELGVQTLGLVHCSGERIGQIWRKKYGNTADFHVGERVVVEIV